MPYKFQSDTELEKSTNRVTVWGVVLMVALAAAFPLYRWVEPTGRTDARAQQLESLAEQGAICGASHARHITDWLAKVSQRPR